MNTPPIVKNMALRTGALFLVKLIGFFVRIPLFRLLGPEGIGLYQMAYSVYGLFLTAMTGGFPTALALATAKNRSSGWRLFKGLVFLMLLLGAGAGFASYTFAPRLAGLIGDSRLDFALRCFAPAIMIVPLLSLLRGFLQGLESYSAIALSELIEQTVRVGMMILLVTLWMKMGLSAAVGGAALGAFGGAFATLLFLAAYLVAGPPRHWIGFTRIVQKGRKLRFSDSPGLLLFVHTSFAIAAARLVVPLSDFLDAFIIPHRLHAAGLSMSEATAVFGRISGMAATIVYMPSIVTSALSFTLSTKIAADWQLLKRERFFERSRLALDIGLLWGGASAVVLFIHADELSRLVFGTDSAAAAVRAMAFAPLAAGVRDISTTVLWAADRRKEPLHGLLAGVLCSVALNYYLFAIPGIATGWAAACLPALDAVAGGWNIAAIRRYGRDSFRWLPRLPDLTLLAVLAVVSFYARAAIFHPALVGGFASILTGIAVTYGILMIYILIRLQKRTAAAD